MARVCSAGFAAAVVALLLPSAASSQTWPNRPVTIMMPQPAGGIADLLARGTAQALSAEFGQPQDRHRTERRILQGRCANGDRSARGPSAARLRSAVQFHHS